MSYSDVVHGTLHDRDVHNIVQHEFAHKLDEENTIIDGLLVLRNSADYKKWAEVLNREYHALMINAEHHDKSVMVTNGTVSPAELFAVAAETFFEKQEKCRKNCRSYTSNSKILWPVTLSPDLYHAPLRKIDINKLMQPVPIAVGILLV